MADLTIWKATLKPVGMQLVEMPIGAEILCAREQREEMCIWYRCDPNAPKESRTIAIVGTGHPAPSGRDARYIDTVSLRGGALIFHVFEWVRP
jgi:hypothetical protein